MPNRSRTAEKLLQRLHAAGIQIVPRGDDQASIRGQFGPAQHDVLLAVLPELKAQWPTILDALENRDANQSAKATLDILTAESGESPAVTLGRRGGLKGGKARAESLTKKRRAEIAKKAAQARWSPKG
jgi:hypothetical protein